VVHGLDRIYTGLAIVSAVWIYYYWVWSCLSSFRSYYWWLLCSWWV